LKIIKGLE